MCMASATQCGSLRPAPDRLRPAPTRTPEQPKVTLVAVMRKLASLTDALRGEGRLRQPALPRAEITARGFRHSRILGCRACLPSNTDAHLSLEAAGRCSVATGLIRYLLLARIHSYESRCRCDSAHEPPLPQGSRPRPRIRAAEGAVWTTRGSVVANRVEKWMRRR